MTTAGTIRVGVDIDATGLGARLHNAISAQLAPVMAQLRTQTQGTGNDFGDLARRAELSSARQVVALRRVVEQLHDVRNAALQAHTALNSLHGPGGNSVGPLGTGGNVTINRNTYDYRNYSVTNNHYNNSTTTIHNNGGGGGGPGGGGNNNHGGGSGGGSRLTSPLTLGAVGLGANLLPAATLAATNLLGAVQQLSQAGLALPGIFAGGIASVGTAVIGFQGMGDAIKAINKAMAEGASKADAKKMAAALKDMDDNAKDVALTFATDFLPEFKKIQSEVVQHNMFDGIAKGLTGLKDKSLPTFKRGLGDMSSAWNDTFKRIIGAAGDSKNLSLVDRIFGNSAEGQKRANQAIAPITRAMLELSSSGSEFLPRLGDGITKLTTRFGDFVSKNVASGQMWKWIDEGLNGMRALGNSVLNIGKVLTGLTKTAGGDGGILGWLEKSTGKLQSFVNSPAGQAKLQAFFDGARESMRDWAPILKDVMRLVGDVIDGFQNWGAVILPVIGGITHGLASVPNLVSAAVTAFAAFKTVKGLGGMLNLTGAAAGGGAGGGGGLSGFFGSKKFGLGMLGLGGLALGTGLQQDPNAGTGQRVIGGLTSVASGALLGGTIGSILPGPGTAIGAGIGALAGGAIAIYNDAMGQSARSAQAAADAQKRLADAQEHAAATADSARNIDRDLGVALTNSGGKIDASTVFGVADKISLIPDQIKAQIGPDAKEQVDKLIKGLNVRPDQLAQQVVGTQGVFDALIAQLGGQGSAGSNFATALRGLRDRTLSQADTAALGAPLLNAVAGESGRTPDMVQADLQALIRAQGQGRGFNVNAPGGADLLKQLQGAGLPLSAGQGGAITGTLTPDQFKQLAAASGVPIINMPGGGIGIPAARPAGPNLQALPNPQQQNLMNLAAAAGGGVVPPAGGPPVPPIGPGLTGPVPVQIVGTPPPNTNPLAGLASAAAGPTQPAAPAGPPPDIAQSLGVKDLTKAIEGIPPAKIDVQAPEIPKAQQDLKGIWDQISDVNKTPLKIDANTDAADQKIRSLFSSYQSRTLTIPVGASATGGAPLGTGHADGGVLPGYSPGSDNLLVPMSGGEGVVIPEAMRALGGSWLYGINSRFRSGLSRRGYATGGVVGADGALGAPDNSVIGLLTQIRDALVGRGSSALATTADNTTQMAQALGPKAKPFGGDVGKGALAGAIKALGGDPNLMDWGGYSGDGQLLVPKAGFNAAGLSAGVPPGVAAALQAFARSGNTADLGGGLSVTDPVVRAIVTARNKKTGLSDDQIAGLVGQVLGGGGFQGVLDPTNTPLVNALTAYQNKANRPVRGSAPVAAGTGVGLTPLGGFDAALLSQVPAGQYSQTGAADLTKGLADCSSSVEDLVNLMDGSSTAGRSLSTANAAQWFPEHGFLPGTMPGAFNVGFNSGHMQASLPDGTPFNWGSDAAAARGGVGGTGAFDPAFTQQFYRPVTGMPLGGGLGPGMGANPLGYSGGPVPVYIVSGPGGGGGFGQQLGGQLFGDALTAAAPAVADAAGSIITGIDQGTQLERNSTKDRPAVRTGTLMKEGNPLSVAALAGYTVPDFTRQGWNGEVMTNSGPGFTAGGQMMSDTASLIMRTFTDTQAAADARQQQMLSVLDQIKTQLSESVLKPIIQSAVQNAMAAGGQAVQQGASGGGGALPGLADGGAIWGGTPGVDSVPLMGMPGEHVLTTKDVSAMGGQRGVYAFRAALHRNGGMRGFAGGGGIGNDTVGADFFGVSQVPIVGDIINLIIKILLKVIGVEIAVRDTMNRMSSDFRQFRGDFKAFEASGRLMNDTSGLVDRSGSSEETVVAERVRIFKQVLEGLIKFIIQKIVIPITQAIASTLLNAGASAAGGAVSGGLAVTPAAPAAGIAGSLVSSLISSGGQAGINIGGEIAQMIAGAATGPIVGLLTDGFMGIFGKLLNPILTGGIGGLLSAFFPFLAFDDGGLANGVGLLPKATVEPERVLSPRQTSLFEEMVRANFTTGGDNSRRIDVGGIHLYGADAKPEVVVDHLTKLLA